MLGEVVSYNSAYRAIRANDISIQQLTAKSYELIVPYLEAFMEQNPGSMVSCDKDPEGCIQRVFICPGFMNSIYQYVRPVISCDAAHLKSERKGQIYIYSVLSAANEVYILAFGIAMGNEDFDNWLWMNEKLERAMPCIKTRKTDTAEIGTTRHNPGSFAESDDEVEVTNEVTAGGANEDTIVETTFNDTVFISDRDKGLAKSLEETFPNNHSVKCGKHIQANVIQRFGQVAGKFVIQLAKAYSTKAEAYFLQMIQNASAPAFAFLNRIPRNHWRSTEWAVGEPRLPRRYGIVTSNTSESINSMIADIRTCGWLGVIEKMVHGMVSRICKNRLKHKSKNAEGVVQMVRDVIKKRWNDSAALEVDELVEDNGKFMVTELYQDGDEGGGINANRNEDQLNNQEVAGNVDLRNQTNLTVNSRTRTNVVVPDKETCSCGKWQDFRYPCRHGVAYYHKWLGKDLAWILENKVHYYYKHAALHGLYQPNVHPVITDGLRYDGRTKQPKVKVSTGRPKVKRIRRRSKFIEPGDSNVSCSNCKQKGHNCRTCPNARTMDA